MSSLYEIATAFRADAERLSDLDLDPQTLDDTIESLTYPLEVKAQNVVYVARNLEALAESIKEAEAGMAARRKALENRAAHLRAYALACLQASGVQKLECPHFRISVCDNPPSVDVFDAGQIPSVYMRTPEPPPPSPNKVAIKAAIKAGIDVPGARMAQSQRLEVK